MSRPLLAAAPLVVLAVLVTGCGGDGGTGAAPSRSVAPTTTNVTPTEPPPADLCEAVETAYAALAEQGDLPTTPAEALPADLVTTFHELGDDLGEVPLPPDFTDDQVEGVALMSRLFRSVADDATGSDLAALQQGLTSAEDRQIDAVNDYVDVTCSAVGP